MGLNYNEAVFEAFGVAAVNLALSQTATHGIGPIYMIGVRRIYFLINMGTPVGAGAFTPKLQCCKYSDGTFQDLSIGTPVQITAAGLYIYEYQASTIQQAIDALVAAANANAGPFIKMLMTLSGTSAPLAEVALVSTSYSPASDIVTNPYLSTYPSAGAFTLTTTPLVTKANTFIDGVAQTSSVALPY